MTQLASFKRAGCVVTRLPRHPWNRTVLLAAVIAPVGLTPFANAQLASGEPAAEPAVPAIIAVFSTHQVVGMNAGHRMKDLDDFILGLVRTPAFADVVNDIVVECGNPRYQLVLDRYTAGEDVPLADVQQVWRNTTVPQMCTVSPFYAELFPLVRRINQALPPAKRLRVIAADAPIDWSAITTQADFARFLGARDSSIAAIMEKEVLSKHRKALMLFGSVHLAHGLTTAVAATARTVPGGFAVASAVGRFEERYPGVTFTIDLVGCGAPTTTWGPNVASWPVPSLLKVRGTRLAPPANSLLPGPDGLLYLGNPDLLLFEFRPAFLFLDDTLVAELRRRVTLMRPTLPLEDYIDPSRVRDRDASNPFLCNRRS